MPGGINIDNLTGMVKAFAEAANQNDDRTLDAKEVKVFDQLVNRAGLTNDDQLIRERQQQPDVDPAVKAKQDKQILKEEKKQYGKQFGSDHIDDVKDVERDTTRVVGQAIKKLVAAGLASSSVLNGFIAGRPDLADYAEADVEENRNGYKQALRDWARDIDIEVTKMVETKGNAKLDEINQKIDELKIQIQNQTIELKEEMQVNNNVLIEELNNLGDKIETKIDNQTSIIVHNNQIYMKKIVNGRPTYYVVGNNNIVGNSGSVKTGDMIVGNGNKNNNTQAPKDTGGDSATPIQPSPNPPSGGAPHPIKKGAIGKPLVDNK